MAPTVFLCVTVFVCVWFNFLDVSNGSRIAKCSSLCLPEVKCPRPSQLTRLNSFCGNGQVCCLKILQKNTNFKMISELSRHLLRQNKPNLSSNNNNSVPDKNVLRHLLSKRDLGINSGPMYLQNQLGLYYPYPYSYPIPRHNFPHNSFNAYFQKQLTNTVHNKLNTDLTNRIINKNESRSATQYYFTAPPAKQYTKISNKRTRQKDNVVFEDNEYQLDDPFAENIKRNFERYLKEERSRGAVIKFIDSGIDDRISDLKNRPGEKIVKYCEDYEKYINNGTSKDVKHFPNDLSHNPEEKSRCSLPMPLIVGGHKTRNGEFPHMAGLGFDRGHYIEFLCGGSLISPRFVLTAAHCAKTKWGNPVMVRLGVNNLVREGGQNIDVEKIIVHPDYKPPACYNDIALIKIVEGVKLGPNLRPACLPTIETTADEPKQLVTATGWGRTGYGKFSSPNLLKVTLQIVGRQECEKSFVNNDTSKRLANGITDNMICASGYLKSSHDTCQGDSGGPIQALLPNNECMFQIVGITSFGKLCGTGLPGVYTKVSAFLPWIEDIVWPS